MTLDTLACRIYTIPEYREYRGWVFSYEYPGLFHYSHPDSCFSVFFTPDWDEDETLPIQVQDDAGNFYEEHSAVLPLPLKGRTAQKIFDLVRSTLDALPLIKDPA